MKAPSIASICGTVTAAANDALPNAERSLQWVDEVAALLPEESRFGWYKNVRPWLRMLPPDDEVAHLAYSMGYLALLTRTTPELIAAERVQFAALFHRLTEEITGSVKTTAVYHQKLNDRLMILPGEISQGLSPAALAAEIVDGVKEQFLRSGVSEAGRQLNEQGYQLRELVSTQNHVLAEFRQQLNDSRSHVTWVLNSVVSSADSAKKSIDLWNHEMRKVQWIYLGLVLLIGLLLGALLYWWALTPQEVSAQRHESPMQLQQLPAAIPERRPDMNRNDLTARWSERETKRVVRHAPGNKQAHLKEQEIR